MDATLPPDVVFEIGDGVHRCVAAREAGLGGVLATVYRDGQPPLVRLIELDRLYSPKSTIGRWDKGRDLFDLVRRLTTTAGRASFEKVMVTQVSPTAAARMTRLADVVILEDEEEDP